MSSLLQPDANKGKENTLHKSVAGIKGYGNSTKDSTIPETRPGDFLTTKRTNFYSTSNNSSKKKFDVCPQPSLNRSGLTNKRRSESLLSQTRLTPTPKLYRTMPSILRSAPAKRNSTVKPSSESSNGNPSDDDFCETSDVPQWKPYSANNGVKSVKCNGNSKNDFPTYNSFRSNICSTPISSNMKNCSTKTASQKRPSFNIDDFELEELINGGFTSPVKGSGNSAPNHRKPLEDVRPRSQQTQNGSNHRKPLEDVQISPKQNKNFCNATYSKSPKSYSGNVCVPAQNGSSMQSVQDNLSSPQSNFTKRFKPTQKEENKENNMAIQEDSQMFGLKNLGNSCYINSAMQSLLGLDMLAHNLLAVRSQAIKVQWSDLFESVCMLMLAKVSSRERSSLQIETIVKKLRDAVKTKYTQFEGSRMQDSAEFLALLMEGLKTEIIAKVDKEILPDPFSNNFDLRILTTTQCSKCAAFNKDTVNKHILQVTAAADDANQDTKSIQDVINDYFVPKEVHAFTCPACNFQHEKIVPTSVQVSGLPRVLIIELSRCFYVGVNAIKSSKRLLIQKFISLKNVASDAVPPVAYQHTNSEFSELSEICYNGVFSNNGSVTHSRNEDISKVDGNDGNDQQYDHDLQQALRLSEEDNIPKSPELETTFTANPADANLDLDIEHALADTEETSHCAYQLVSIISHIGSEISSGHYVSDVYNMSRRCWSHCSDLSVRSIAEKDVLLSCQSSGCVFFYVHRDSLPTRV